MPCHSRKYKIVQYARHDSGIDHGGYTHREALDLQQQLTIEAGSQSPDFMYRIEEDGKREVQTDGAITSTGGDSGRDQKDG